MVTFTDKELSIIAIILDEEIKQSIPKKQSRCMKHGKRDIEGEFLTLYKELIKDGTKFYKYFKMSEYCFNTLLNMYI